MRVKSNGRSIEDRERECFLYTFHSLCTVSRLSRAYKMDGVTMIRIVARDFWRSVLSV
jgi:hypothetical protein